MKQSYDHYIMWQSGAYIFLRGEPIYTSSKSNMSFIESQLKIRSSA